MYLPRKNSLGWRYLWALSALIVGLMLVNYFWSSNYFYRSEFDKLRQKAEIVTEQFVAMRSFIAQNQDRINYDSAGNFEFKHLNPAAVGRGVGDLLVGGGRYTVKQTRLHVRNPANEPDLFEREALRRFAENPGLKEIYSESRIDGKHVFRYIIPVYLETACLSCHGEPAGVTDVSGFAREGLREGELAGAISVRIPMDSAYISLNNSRKNLVYYNIILLLATLAGVLFITGRLVVQPLQALTNKALQVGQGDLNGTFEDVPAYGEVATLTREFSAMVATLKDLYQNMERKVATRTRELEAANLRLTEGKKALTQLNQKISENNRLKSEFMATMTHELRTPLTSIVAFCELLLDEVPGPINAEQRENLLDIKTSAQQLMILISDILDMAKFEAGHLRLEKERVDLNDVFRVVRRTMSSIAYQNGIRLDVDRVNLPLVAGDPERLRQMVVNLTSNAIKYTKEGGRIHISAHADKNYAAIVVQDTGDGIPPELLPFIFEKFRQGDSSMKRRRSGTGLGLALVKTLAELHDGTVAVASEIGRGTEFIIRIPFIGNEGGNSRG